MHITLFGIPTCDSVRKAKKWLTANELDFTFHDFRKQGIESNWLNQIEQKIGWETLLNKRGTSFRQLNEADKSNLDKDKAIQLMMNNPTLIKRPVLTIGETALCGFSEAKFAEVLR